VSFSIVGESFEHPVLPIQLGAKVQVINNGKIARRVRATSIKGFFTDESGPVNPTGARISSAVSDPLKPITIGDVDTVHLRAKIVAFKSPYFTTLSGSNFEIANVPAGTWNLKVWYQDGWLKMPPVTVKVAGKRPIQTKVQIPPAMSTQKPGN
jgi:hypothetical protein